MSFSGKHQFGAIEDHRVTFVEKKTTKERVDFLKELLEYNGYEVMVSENKRKNEEDQQLYDLAVTDMAFNPTIAVFQRLLKTKEGHMVTPDYWHQRSDKTNPNYWDS